jgi:hypothetical protein
LIESLEAAQWIKLQIENDSTLTAWYDLIPPKIQLPAVRYSQQAANDVNGIATMQSRIITDIRWLVVIVKEGLGIASLVPLANEVDAALHDQEGSTPTVYVECVRLEPFTLMETDDSGVSYRHVGGIYRTLVYAK